ncbi:hypothetical protein ACIOJE_27945 [Kitasatospora sp. NPDC087861]|uniref:hypothetical protein n=1 Tax=Kitasatospora sp. NPDC087861 TaxID=3364070 RepID=UPI00382FC76E
MSARPLPTLTLALDPGDTPACSHAALAAHDPAAGQVTVHPTPGTDHPAGLAHDVLAALGKPYTPPGRWNTQPALTWAAAAAWAHTTGLNHLILLRGHLLTPARWHHLLTFQQHTGAHLTVICHRTPTPALTRALAHVDHTITYGLPAYALPGPEQHRRPPPARTAPAISLPWLTLPALTYLALTDRPEPPCDCTPPPATADRLPIEPPPGRTEEAANRLHRLTHPTHAAALAAALITGVPFNQLAAATPTDYHSARATLTLHAPARHRTPARCAAYRVPAWARPLLDAATHYHQHRKHPGPRLLTDTQPALTTLLQAAEHCRLRPPQDPSGRSRGRFPRPHFPEALPDGPHWTACIPLPNLPPELQAAALQ